MFQLNTNITKSRLELYSQLGQELSALVQSENDFIANSANMSSLLFHRIPEINWSGFYIKQNDQLVLGPFHGKPACVRIKIGEGVCGKAAKEKKSILVADVHKFPGHIACDPDSRSEVVVPLIKDDQVLGVLDIDSPSTDRFNKHDQEGLESLVHILLNATYELPARQAV